MSKTINVKQKLAISILELLRKSIPNPKLELNYQTPFELLMAVVLSAHSTDVGVNKATAKTISVANTPEAILQTWRS